MCMHGARMHREPCTATCTLRHCSRLSAAGQTRADAGYVQGRIYPTTGLGKPNGPLAERPGKPPLLNRWRYHPQNHTTINSEPTFGASFQPRLPIPKNPPYLATSPAGFWTACLDFPASCPSSRCVQAHSCLISCPLQHIIQPNPPPTVWTTFL